MTTAFMSDDDIACLWEFVEAGNGEAMFDCLEENESLFDPDQYVTMLNRSAAAGHYLAAEGLEYVFGNGKEWKCSGRTVRIQKNAEKARIYGELAAVLSAQRERANANRILICDFYGWMKIRCGSTLFDNSYLFPTVPLEFLEVCAERLENDEPLSLWFSDEDHGHNMEEEVVDGKERLFIRWKNDDGQDQAEEFPDYDFVRFATQIADDIQSNYYGWASFLSNGNGFRDAVKKLKHAESKLRKLLETKRTRQ